MDQVVEVAKGGHIQRVCGGLGTVGVLGPSTALGEALVGPPLCLVLCHTIKPGSIDDPVGSTVHFGLDCEVRQPVQQSNNPLRIWTDAKATEQAAWIGGWLGESGCSKECRWFSCQVTEEMAPWLFYRGKNPKRVIAALELLATLVALKLWLRGAGDTAEVHAEAFTDNKGNAFILRKGLSTKYPVTLLVIEVLRRLDA